MAYVAQIPNECRMRRDAHGEGVERSTPFLKGLPPASTVLDTGGLFLQTLIQSPTRPKRVSPVICSQQGLVEIILRPEDV